MGRDGTEWHAMARDRTGWKGWNGSRGDGTEWVWERAGVEEMGGDRTRKSHGRCSLIGSPDMTEWEETEESNLGNARVEDRARYYRNGY